MFILSFFVGFYISTRTCPIPIKNPSLLARNFVGYVIYSSEEASNASLSAIANASTMLSISPVIKPTRLY